MTLRSAKHSTLEERAAFLDRLRVVEARSLLTIGAGPDSDFFASAGLSVTAVDDPTALPGGPFDAAYVSVDKALPAVREVLEPGGLLFVGLFDGSADLVGTLARSFEVIDFHTVEAAGRLVLSATLVRPLNE